MKIWYIKYVIVFVAISLLGLVFTQIFWLKRAVEISERQFDDRADRMLHDILGEVNEYSIKAKELSKIPNHEQELLDVVDTALVNHLVKKYASYHCLDTNYAYALIKSSNGCAVFSSDNFTMDMESSAYKGCLWQVWKKGNYHISVFFPNKTRSIYRQLSSWILLSLVFLLIVTSAFIFITYNFLRQKKITEIKNDFINNMTHEFKTPISTISIASEMLMNSAIGVTKEKVDKYARIIYDENQRMRSQVELVLQTALIDKGQLKLNKDRINLHDLIKSAVSSFSLEALEKETSIQLNLEAQNPQLLVDPVHFRNVVTNMIDNAIKYSGQLAKIILGTQTTADGVMISVTDNGIGMSNETQKKIFDKFYRVSMGNIHNVKGFGLGLYYVKTIVEAHQGIVSVESKLNMGSTFYVYLPQSS